MFLNLDQIKNALVKLKHVHPFFGISYLVFKAGRLPVGRTVHFPSDSEDEKFLNVYYRPSPNSNRYYRVFGKSENKERWWQERYPSTTLQSMRTRGHYANALLHSSGSGLWGWKENYLEILRNNLKGKKIPAFDLAVWLYRQREWSDTATASDIVNTFLEEFNITDDEIDALFDTFISPELNTRTIFQPKPVSWDELRTIIGSPPDAPAEQGGTLKYLELRGVGPAFSLSLEFGERINLITGDNGLGKTFLLECAWWALTGYWAGLQAHPRDDVKRNEPRISFQISGETTKSEITAISYNWETQTWQPPKKRPTIPGLLIYARVDGSFAVWDPARHYLASRQSPKEDLPVGSFVFQRDEVWEGLEILEGSKKRVISDGLLRDWTRWQYTPDSKSKFEMFTRVLSRLSPDESIPLEPGEPIRLPRDGRDIPTLHLPYGNVPVVHAAAGMRRIMALAYLMVWTWDEHRIASEQARKEPENRMVILIDEVEAHLHPKWQRLILPSLLDVQAELDSELEVQFLIATHSPLVMVSLEPLFDNTRDKLFHLDLVRNEDFTSEVRLEEIPFIKHGTVDSWLTSENVFELSHARSVEAEQAIEKAKELQEREYQPSPEEVQDVSDMLRSYLADDDEFWPRWVYFAEQYGVYW